MIRVRYKTAGGLLTGFTLSGHAGAGDHGQDIVCAAVSSAAYMTANTVTDVIGATADVTVNDGYMDLTVTDNVIGCQDILSGFRLHLQAMQEQYPTRIQLMNTEV
ncbi:MAG: ribosomal-processing cysteine protease Prp [Clostridia bacterium]|nr:ribosomal-processing cysteine protease Prp [Clostridia bacterium]